MIDAFDILNINGELLENFHLFANRVADHQTEKVINQNVRKLKAIEEQLFVHEGVKVSQQSIDEILGKVVRASYTKSIHIEDWTMRELRIVSYYLMKLQDEELAFEYALRLLDSGWKNMFLNGIVFYLINSWCMIKPELRQKTSQLLIQKLQEYNDNNHRYLLLKNHSNMFTEGGPQRLACLLVAQNKEVREAPIVLGYRVSMLSQLYFSDVIVKYNERKQLNENTLDEIFAIHDIKRTKQLVYANLVKKADESGDTLQQTQLSKFINRTLGDVTLAATWAPFIGATEDEALMLKDTMQRVKLWFARRIIETFFDICVQDKERESFWMNYVSHVSGFKIVGSMTTKQLLKNDPRIGTMFYPYFIETNSTTSQTSALILCIKNYVLIEFSDTGSLYAYKQNHSKVQFLKRPIRKMLSTSILKETSMDCLVEKDYWGEAAYNDEGRLPHIGHWQIRLTNWLHLKVLSKSNTEKSFFETQYDKTFTAQPISAQKKIVKPTESHKDTEYKTVIATKKESTKSIKEGPNELRAVYERRIQCHRYSKWFFDDTCRIGCNAKGFYVHISTTNMYVRIKDSDLTYLTGSIWIKRPNISGWSQIVHATQSRENNIGYIRKKGDELIYKPDYTKSTYMSIKTV